MPGTPPTAPLDLSAFDALDVQPETASGTAVVPAPQTAIDVRLEPQPPPPRLVEDPIMVLSVND